MEVPVETDSMSPMGPYRPAQHRRGGDRPRVDRIELEVRDDMKRNHYLLETVILCLLLMVAGQSAWAQTDLIINGGFETLGLAWVNQTNGVNQVDSWWNINQPSGAHSGNRYYYLGAQQDGVAAANNVNGLLYQTVTIPAGTTSAILSYYVKISTDESPTAAFDHATGQK